MSSVIYVGVGQCGNQILHSFINHELSSERSSYNYLQSQNKKLRCVFVDSESKVLNNIKTQSKFKAFLRDENFVNGLNGRGSNWCYGYNGCKTYPDLVADIIEKIRKEVERCDNYNGLVMCHSLGGGTGSGLGSRLSEMIRDELELHQILNCVVAPSDIGGDNPLQYYNTILSLATINRFSDGILLYHNDSLLNQLGLDISCVIKSTTADYKTNHVLNSLLNRPSSSYRSHQISMGAINDLIALQMGSLLSPCSSLYPWKQDDSSINIELNEFLRSLCSFPESKIIRCVSSNPVFAPNLHWNDVAKSTMRQLKSGFGNIFDTISSVCCFRGDTTLDKHLTSLITIQNQLNAKMHFVDWNKSDAIDIWMDTNPSEPNRITLAFNSGCITNYLRFVKMRSMEKFNSSAYLHWYYKFGGSKELFVDCFDEIDKIISQYHTVTK